MINEISTSRIMNITEEINMRNIESTKVDTVDSGYKNEIDSYIKFMLENKKIENKLNLVICQESCVYDFSNNILYTNDGDSSISIDSKGIHTKSNKYSSTLFFVKTKQHGDSITEIFNSYTKYEKEFYELNNILYQTDKVITTDLSLINLLRKEDYTNIGQDNFGKSIFAKTFTKDIDLKESLKCISDEFKASRAFKEILNNQNRYKCDFNHSHSNLSDFENFQKRKLLMNYTHKVINKNFSSKPKVKKYSYKNKNSI